MSRAEYHPYLDCRAASLSKVATNSTLVPIFTALWILPATTLAENPGFGDTFNVSIGAMSHTGDGFVASTRPDLPLDRLTFAELDLDDDKDVLWASFSWQFHERWQYALTFSSFDTNGIARATASGNFDGVDWAAEAVLTSNLELKLYINEITWNFMKTDKGHVAAGFGLHVTDVAFDLLIEASTTAGNGGVDLIPIGFEQADVLAPLPNLSLVGGYKLGETVYVEGRAGWLSLTYDDYEGELFSFRSSVEWRPRTHMGFGVGYQLVDVDVVVKRSLGREIFNLKFDGPILFVSVGF